MANLLWAPWRMDYIKNMADGPSDCFLCAIARAPEKDAAHFVVQRGAWGMLLLNRFPYVHGHLLIAPYRHEADLTNLDAAGRAEMMELTVHGQRLLTAAMNPQGFNIGINLGRCAGAGVPGHVHMHIVPRWNGDVNFMNVVGETRVIPQALEQSYAEIMRAQASIQTA